MNRMLVAVLAALLATMGQTGGSQVVTVNNLTARKGADGSVPVQFGGCDGAIPNCIPIVKGWNDMVRFYRPRAEILSGAWKFPEARP